MQKYFFVFILSSFILTSCEPVADSTVGSSKDTQISGIIFQIDTVYLDNWRPEIIAKGRAKNSSTYNVSVPWYVEGQFYSDSSFTLKLGGANTKIEVPLSPNQETFWMINFTTENVDLRLYPKATISNVRAIYKN